MAVESQHRQCCPLISKIVAVVASLALCLACPPLSFADSLDDAEEAVEEAEAELSETQALVESTSAAYNEALEQVEELEERIAEIEARISEIEEELPAQRERSAESVRALYIFQRDSLGLLTALLSSETLSEFLTTYEYIDCVNEFNMSEINKLLDMLEELDEQQSELETSQADAEQALADADEALTEAQQARTEAQEAADAAAAAQLEAQEELEAQAEEEEGVDSENTATETPSTTSSSASSSTASGTADSSEVSWSSSKTAFVKKWTKRIDAYLSGSPLAGYGDVFAEAAWDYGVDPRWSPAIATVESSKGTYCFKSYNAWGWGSYSFSSWEESIPKHVAYLASMYGSTITYKAATIYCPSNATFWYNRCLEEMDKI